MYIVCVSEAQIGEAQSKMHGVLGNSAYPTESVKEHSEHTIFAGSYNHCADHDNAIIVSWDGKPPLTLSPLFMWLYYMYFTQPLFGWMRHFAFLRW